MFEYYDNRLAVWAKWLYDTGGVMTKANYDKLRNEKIMKGRQLKVVRPPAPDQLALVDYHSLPERFKRKIEQQVGDPHRLAKKQGLEGMVELDGEAKDFFAEYRKKNGKKLKADRMKEYTWNASILKVLGEWVKRTNSNRKRGSGGITQLWQRAADMLAELDTREYPHSLPLNWRRLRERYDRFAEGGYPSLIHRNEGNMNSRVVTPELERLIISLYCMENNPFASRVYSMYLQFLGRALDVVDKETGEMFMPEAFFKDGKPLEVSESTIWNIINATENQGIIAKMNQSTIDYNTLMRPHAHRHKGEFSLSKISMDDREIPELDLNDKRVTAYYAYDVTSGVFLGAAYGEPGLDLIYESFRDMYRTIKRHGMVWPAQVEVERHLMSDIRDVLDSLFAHVRMCNPANSREKRAEHGIKSLKYGTEKQRVNRGRFYGKGIYKLPQEKAGGKVKQKKYPREVIIANNRADIEKHNHALHPDQKNFPKMTRWDVLVQKQGNYGKPVDHQIMKNIGFRTETSIRNRDYVRVQYADYEIADFDMLSLLKPNNYKVDAYWMPAEGGGISEVYLYQDEDYIGTANKIETFNEALAERTDRDHEIQLHQQKRAAHYDKREKELLKRKVAKVATSETLEKPKPEEVELIPEVVAAETDNYGSDYIKKLLAEDLSQNPHSY